MATISQQLNELINQKTQLANNLTIMGVQANSSEKFNTLVPKVLQIESGIDTSDATATSAEIREGYTAYVNGVKVTGTIPDCGETTYIPTTEDQHFQPGSYISGVQTVKGDANLISDNIKAGVEIFGVAGNPNVIDTTVDEVNTASISNMLKDTVAFVNGTKIIGSCESMGDTVITPSTEVQTITGPKILQGNKTIQVLGDENLISGNIKKGVTIFNVEGSLESKGGIDTSDATAAENDILSGKTAYVNGTKITGTIESLEATTYTPSIENQVILSGKYLSGDQTILGDANLIPENIKSGVSIFNVAGTYSGSGSSGINEKILLDCRNMSSSSEVYNAYTDIVMVSNDGAYATFSNLSDYINYQTIAAVYQQELAGINICTGVSNTGFYFTVPITIQSSHALFKLIYFVSTWINPSIQLNFILADSVDEIPNKIATGDIAWSKSITLANANNKQSSFFEFTDLPIGTYYLFVSMPALVGGNEGIVNCISLINF